MNKQCSSCWMVTNIPVNSTTNLNMFVQRDFPLLRKRKVNQTQRLQWHQWIPNLHLQSILKEKVGKDSHGKEGKEVGLNFDILPCPKIISMCASWEKCPADITRGKQFHKELCSLWNIFLLWWLYYLYLMIWSTFIVLYSVDIGSRMHPLPLN